MSKELEEVVAWLRERQFAAAEVSFEPDIGELARTYNSGVCSGYCMAADAIERGYHRKAKP